jgi:hypothetical protein
LNDEHENVRRKFLVGLVPYVVDSYWKTRSRLNPASILNQAINRFGSAEQDMLKQKETLELTLREIEGLDIAFEDNTLSLYLPKDTLLELVGLYLKTMFAKEGGYTASLILPTDSQLKSLYDVELRLANLRIYAKLVFETLSTADFAPYLAQARSASADSSEYWLFGLNGEETSIMLNPIFLSENKILFGRFRYVGLDKVLHRFLGNRYAVSILSEEDRVKVRLSAPSSV